MSGWRKAADLGASAAVSPYALWWLMRPDLREGGEAWAVCLGDRARSPLATRVCRETGRCAGPDRHRAVEPDELEALLPAVLAQDVLRPDLREEPATLKTAMRRFRTPQRRSRRDPVLIGVIDDAIPFAHERFRSMGGGSRVWWLWVQGAQHDGGTDIPCGREYWQADIEALLVKHARGRALDEAAVYRDAGMLDLTRAEVQSAAFRASHGSAVADLAGGFGMGASQEEMLDVAGQPVPVDPEAFSLAFVCLPPAVVRESSGTFAQPFIIAAIDRIIEQADRIWEATKTDPAVVINLSMGLTAGPKDGMTLLERHIDELMERRSTSRPPLRFVLPAGNHRLAQARARAPAGMAVQSGDAPSRRAPLFWRLPPDDATPSFLEFWGPVTPGAQPEQPRFGVALRPPGWPEAAATPADLAFDAAYDLADAEGRFLARLTVQWRSGKTGGREWLTLAVPPTVADRSGAAIAPPGDWALEILPGPRMNEPGLAVDLFVQRDDTLPAFRRSGRQSRLHDPSYRARGDGGLPLTGVDGGGVFVRHALTINAYATGQAPLVVGGHYRDGSPVEYSGLGDAAGGARDPDLASLADRSPWLRGVPAAGTASGSGASYGGTSIAAPLAAREVAKAIAAGLIHAGVPQSREERVEGLETMAQRGPDSLPQLQKRPEAEPENDEKSWGVPVGMKAP